MLEKKYLSVGTAAVFLLLISFSTQAQESTTAKSEEPSSGSITGRVVNENGQALFGATVFARAVGSFNMVRMTISDNDGNFKVSSLDPAAYSISASSPAYTQARVPDAFPTYYRIGDSVRLELVKGGVITGTVSNATGEPVVAIRVRAFLFGNPNGF